MGSKCHIQPIRPPKLSIVLFAEWLSKIIRLMVICCQMYPSPISALYMGMKMCLTVKLEIS